MEQDKGASADADRAGHEQSQQAVSAVPVAIPSALRAFKVALIAFGGLMVFVGLVVALYFGAYAIAGGWGLIAIWTLIVFVVLWFCALLDIRAQAIEARSGETGTGSTEGESAVGNADAPEPSTSIPAKQGE